MPATEFKIRLNLPLRSARIVSALAPLPPLTPAVTKQTNPKFTTKSPSVEMTRPPASKESKGSEVGSHASADRQLIETLLASLNESIGELQRNYHERLAELQQAAWEIALTIATRLLHRQITAGDFDVEAMVQDMVAQLGEDVPVTIRLNPDDLAMLQQKLEGRPLFPDAVIEPRLVADGSLGRGDGRVECKQTTLLSELPGQMMEIREELMRNLGHASGT